MTESMVLIGAVGFGVCGAAAFTATAGLMISTYKTTGSLVEALCAPYNLGCYFGHKAARAFLDDQEKFERAVFGGVTAAEWMVGEPHPLTGFQVDDEGNDVVWPPKKMGPGKGKPVKGRKS